VRELAGARASLFALELREEARRGTDFVALAAAAVAFAHLALLLAAVLVIVVFWDTHRVAATAGMGAMYAACAVAIYFRLRVRAEAFCEVFPATREEFRQDFANAQGRS
jgi:uncharacterized membrane protein YqjE